MRDEDFEYFVKPEKTKEEDKRIIEKPITLCEKCDRLYIKFEHIDREQPCPHCLEVK